jgi:hypothetical protein
MLSASLFLSRDLEASHATPQQLEHLDWSIADQERTLEAGDL